MSLLLNHIGHTDQPKPRNAMAGVVKIGYLKKNKSMRKKFFVLREETAGGGPARLEYYDTEKKWRNNTLPKKEIVLKSCFNIDKRIDDRTKKSFIYLYTKERYYFILFDCKKELEEWLDLMKVLQRVTNDFGAGDSLKEPLEHIWHVSILKKDLGMNSKLIGMTGLCLRDKIVSIMKYPTKSKEQKSIDIMLSSIRRCGALNTIFYMEVGHSSPFGAGHIWMDTWNTDVATSVHDTIMGASSRNYDPRFRMRSSSFNEGSRLLNCPSRQRSSFYDENNPGLRYKNNSRSSSTLNNGNVDITRTGSVRQRCDSMPLRPRTISENTTSSTRSFNGILSPKQTFHKGCNCVSASSSLSAFNDSNLSTWDASLSKSTDTTDGISSFYSSCLNDHRSAILEENQEDFVSYTPLDKEGSLRQTSDINVNNNINLINNNIVGNKSSSSSQAGSCCDSNSPYGSPINLDDSYTPFNPSGMYEMLPPPDGYLLMKPGYTVSNDYVMPMERHGNSKQDPTEMTQTEFESTEGYVPMTPVDRMSDYVPMDCRGSIESGTPSTDTRFSDIHLDKVCAYLTPSEDEGPIERPTRAYSVGSRPDGSSKKIDKIFADRIRARAFSAGSRGRLPPNGLNGYHSGSTSMSEQSDNGDRMEIDFSCNSKSRRHYSETCRSLSIQPPAHLTPRSSPKLCPTPEPSCIHRTTGRSPPKSLVSSVDIKRTLSGAVHGISRSPPSSSHTYLSPTLERVSEVPSIELMDSYTPMKPTQGLLPCENTNIVVEESSKKNYVNVWEAASSTFPLMKMIGGLNWKKNKKRSTTPVLEQNIPMADEGIDETDCYTTIKPGVHTTPIQRPEQLGQSSDAVLEAIYDGLADLVFSDQPPIVKYNSQNHSKSENSVSSLDGKNLLRHQ